MSELTNLIEELQLIQNDDAWHGPGLKKILEDITLEHALKRHAKGSHTVWELVLHIAAWENVFTDRLEGQTKVEPETGDFPPVSQSDEASWNDAQQYLHNAHERLIQKISQLREADLQSFVPGKNFTVAFMLHGIVRHNVYHAGQIRLLSKL